MKNHTFPFKVFSLSVSDTSVFCLPTQTSFKVPMPQSYLICLQNNLTLVGWAGSTCTAVCCELYYLLVVFTQENTQTLFTGQNSDYRLHHYVCSHFSTRRETFSQKETETTLNHEYHRGTNRGYIVTSL